MRANQVKMLLNCSYTTLKNYLRAGKLKLNKVTDSKLYDYNEASVYELLGKMSIQKNTTNMILVVDKDGNKHQYFVDGLTIDHVVAYLDEQKRLNRE